MNVSIAAPYLFGHLITLIVFLLGTHVLVFSVPSSNHLCFGKGQILALKVYLNHNNKISYLIPFDLLIIPLKVFLYLLVNIKEMSYIL